MKIRKLASILLLGVALAACSKVPAGNVGVKVYLLGGNKGVDTEELGPGRYWIGVNEDLFLFPTFTQNYTWTSESNEQISFQTIEGMKVSADIGISYSIDPTKVNDIFQKYRKGIDEITDIYLRNMVRDALVIVASSRPVETVYGAGKEELIAEVQRRVKEQVEPIGIRIEKIYWVGDIILPPEVIKSLNAKIQANQQAQQRQNEIATAKAEAQKKIEEARGEAESIKLRAEAQALANEKIARSLTDELVKYQAIQKWDGVLPRMTGEGAIPFIDADKLSASKQE